MKINTNPVGLSCGVLCGGLGTRISPVWSGKPKCLLPWQGATLISSILGELNDVGFDRIVLLTSYGHDAIVEYCKVSLPAITVHFSKQEKPRGTAEAVLLAMETYKGSDFYFVNGDTLYERQISMEELTCLDETRSYAWVGRNRDGGECVPTTFRPHSGTGTR